MTFCSRVNYISLRENSSIGFILLEKVDKLTHQEEVAKELKGWSMFGGQSFKNELAGSKKRDALRTQNVAFIPCTT